MLVVRRANETVVTPAGFLRPRAIEHIVRAVDVVRRADEAVLARVLPIGTYDVVNGHGLRFLGLGRRAEEGEDSDRRGKTPAKNERVILPPQARFFRWRQRNNKTGPQITREPPTMPMAIYSRNRTT
jgi:hypothetical protein